ncbi:MAG: DUF4031 domain-containing protein [Acidimicrobiales bacterium]
MAILVDEAIWPWRSERWAHLVTDSHLLELHAFAHELGVPYLAFQGDHYDVPTPLRDEAVRRGARPVTGREVVAALRAAGLRRRGAVESWQWVWRTPAHALAPDAVPDLFAGELDRAVRDLSGSSEVVEVGLASRSAEQLLVATTTQALRVSAGVTSEGDGVTVHRTSGARGTWIELHRPL